MKIWGDWRRFRDVCCWFVAIATSWNDCWNSVTIIYDHYRFAIWLLHSDSDQLQMKWRWFELSTASCGDLRHLGNDWEGLWGIRHEKCRLLWARHLLWRRQKKFVWRRANKCTKKTLHLITNYSKWGNGGRGEILYIRVDTWMSKIWRKLNKNK